MTTPRDLALQRSHRAADPGEFGHLAGVSCWTQDRVGSSVGAKKPLASEVARVPRISAFYCIAIYRS
jgi:hypothetical protein